MPFDLRPLFQALLALWSITTSVTSYQGNVLEVADAYLILPVIYGIFFLAGLSETYGTRAVTLFLNKVGRRPFFIVLLLTALTYVAGGIVWTLSIAVVLGQIFPEAAAEPRVVVVAVALGYIPLLFAFLGFIPYLGPAILALLQGLSLLTTTVAMSVGYGLSFTQAAISTVGGWLIFQVLRWFAAGPTTAISRWVLRVVTGREVNYQLRDVAPTVPLGLQRHRHTLEDGGER
ncbi:hypothetical protein [Candidatus Chloroploca sp. Khr17]|uniref:hypothetical protein n=1 Tax=Candidatus Chloroploca sp. Khr17 TaxID=2496869 RepID=UPI00101D5E52|nr:hypothetical protein [Candidatus Chloroploca sp. Khr17]